MTWTYYQSHWKWYKWVKLNEYYHHAKSDSYHIYNVQENSNIKVFAMYRHTQPVNRPNTDHYIDSHFSCQLKNKNHSSGYLPGQDWMMNAFWQCARLSSIYDRSHDKRKNITTLETTHFPVGDFSAVWLLRAKLLYNVCRRSRSISWSWLLLFLSISNSRITSSCCSWYTTTKARGHWMRIWQTT